MTPMPPNQDPLPDIRLGVVRSTTYGLLAAPEVFVPQARALGAGTVRVNLYWSQIEPEPGTFDWTAVDMLLDQLDGEVEAWVTVCSSSTWATTRPARWLPAAPAVDIERYRRFVAELAARRPGLVRFWQCEIEPCLPLFWAGDADDYLAQLRAFHAAVKQADPAALVVLGGAVPGAMLGDGPAGAHTWASFFDQVLRDGGDHFDVFDLHPYGDPYTVPELVEVCRSQMAAHGYQKPVVAGEHSGPLPTQFPDNLPHLASALATHQKQFLGQTPMPDTAEAVENTREPAVVELYEQMAKLPPTLQMFMAGCPSEMEDMRHRLACQDLVKRAVLALSAGVRRNFHYPLAPEWRLRGANRMVSVLMFDKLKLMDYDGDTIGHRYPAADTFAQLARHLDGAEQVQRITVPDRPNLYLFAIRRTGRADALVVWERTDEDQPPAEFAWDWPHLTATVVDVFGAVIAADRHDGVLRFPVSETPVFVEAGHLSRQPSS